jgi:hypothetical protein
MENMQTAGDAKRLQFPKLQRGADGDRLFSEHTLKLLLKKKKEELKLSKPLLLPSQTVQQASESTEKPGDTTRILEGLNNVVAFSQRFMELKTTAMVCPRVNSLAMLIKDKDELAPPSGGDPNR